MPFENTLKLLSNIPILFKYFIVRMIYPQVKCLCLYSGSYRYCRLIKCRTSALKKTIWGINMLIIENDAQIFNNKIITINKIDP